MEDNNITIGSDPEFVIMCGDSVSNALDIFSKVFEEDLSCIEPEEIDLNEITLVFKGNKSSCINEALNNISDDYLIILDLEISAKSIFGVIPSEPEILMLNDTIKSKTLHYFELSIYAEKGETFDDLSEEERLELIKEAIIEEFISEELINEILDDYDPITKGQILEQIVKNLNKEYIQLKYDLEELPQLISEYIKDDIIENWEYDFSSNGDYTEHFCSAEIGCDGYSVTGEMRPRFGNDPIEHFNEILKLIKELSEVLEPEIVCYEKEFQIKAGTVQGLEWGEETILLGGHIHIGYDVAQRVYIAKYLGLMLSMFVGIPLTLIEQPDEIDKRHKIYGKFNDIKPKEYGIEFRMPSSWLVSPEITIGALSLAYVVADEFITKSNTGIKSSSIDLLFEGTKKYEDIYYKMLHDQFDGIDTYYYDKLISISETLYKNIKTMRLYPEYKEYIDYIFNMIKKGEYWNSDADILVTWSEVF